MTVTQAAAAANTAGPPPAATGARLVIQRLKVSRGKQALINDISFQVRPGELISVFGAQEASAAALLRALYATKRQADGTILVNNEKLSENWPALHSQMAYVPKESTVHTGLTVAEALDFAARLSLPRGTRSQFRQARVQQVLAAVGLADQQKTRISRLDALDRRKVELGAELVRNPALVLLEAPACEMELAAEDSFFALLRRLAQQGLTILAATRASGPLLLGDKALILAASGEIAWYGPPAEAQPFLTKELERAEAPADEAVSGVAAGGARGQAAGFDALLNNLDGADGQAALDWPKLYRNSMAYRLYTGEVKDKDKAPILAPDERPLAYLAGVAAASGPAESQKPPSAFSQFSALTARSLRLLRRARGAWLALLCLPWLLAGLDLVFSDRYMYDPVAGNAERIHLSLSLLIFFVMGLAGAFWVRQISGEASIYRHERREGLGLLPYLFSKIWLVLWMALYQALVWTAVHFLWVIMPGGLETALYFFVTLGLAAFTGGLLGLVASALARHDRSAPAWLAALLIPQLVFGGALLPLGQLNAAGQALAAIMPARYAFDALVSADGHADALVTDACWQLPPDQRLALTDAQKQSCTCLGINIFSQCNFPGVRDFYTSAVDQPEPARPSGADLPLLPVQPMPRPGETLDQYLNDVNNYTLKLEGYSQDANVYLSSLRTYMDSYTTWQSQRSLAVGHAEGLLEMEYERFEPAFEASLLNSWLALLGGIALCVVFLMVIQKRKDGNANEG